MDAPQRTKNDQADTQRPIFNGRFGDYRCYFEGISRPPSPNASLHSLRCPRRGTGPKGAYHLHHHSSRPRIGCTSHARHEIFMAHTAAGNKDELCSRL